MWKGINADSRAEAEAIASIIFNRSTAIAKGTAPIIRHGRRAGQYEWGANSSLTAVVQAPNQFAGFSEGQAIRDSGVEMNEGQRNCSRLQTAGAAVAWLASNPAARQPYLYMCSEGHVTTSHPEDDVHINHNVFSTKPLGCRS